MEPSSNTTQKIIMTAIYVCKNVWWLQNKFCNKTMFSQNCALLGLTATTRNWLCFVILYVAEVILYNGCQVKSCSTSFQKETVTVNSTYFLGLLFYLLNFLFSFLCAFQVHQTSRPVYTLYFYLYVYVSASQIH